MPVVLKEQNGSFSVKVSDSAVQDDAKKELERAAEIQNRIKFDNQYKQLKSDISDSLANYDKSVEVAINEFAEHERQAVAARIKQRLELKAKHAQENAARQQAADRARAQRQEQQRIAALLPTLSPEVREFYNALKRQEQEYNRFKTFERIVKDRNRHSI
jgi:dGTP triphosphohydrolase